MEVNIDTDESNRSYLNIVWKDHSFRFPLKWLIFGSKTSQDVDIAIYVPPELIIKMDRHYLEICEQLDKCLVPILKTNKPINSCLVFWDNQKLIWCQKGGIDESHNSYVLTFDNHQQMLQACPLVGLMERDVNMKICGATRMLIGTLSSASYHGDSRKILREMLTKPEITQIQDINNFILVLIGRLPDIQLSKDDKTKIPKNILAKLQKLKLVRQTRNKLMKILIDNLKSDQNISNVLNNIFSIIDLAHEIVDDFLHSYDFDSELYNKIEKCILDSTFDLGWIARGSMKSRLLIIQLHLLTLVDWRLVKIGDEEVEKYKKISFQLGQADALMDEIELFDKEELMSRYPTLKPFLSRDTLTIGDLENLTIFANCYATRILELMNSKHIDNDISELGIREIYNNKIMDNVKFYI